MNFTADDMGSIRSRFPALARQVGGRPAAFLDGAAGSQVPQTVIDAIGDYLAHRNANHCGEFATSRESDAMLEEAHQAAADFLGVDDSDTVAFGANMTSLTFALSRALAQTWTPGDEILLTRLDHDGNFTPWQLAARDAGAAVREAVIHATDCTLDLDDFKDKLNGKTRLVAFAAASNFSGTINPISDLCAMAHSAGAQVFIDAVHYAPHRRIDVDAWQCDFLTCSAYKFFGPHVGLLWGRREFMENLAPYKLRVAPNSLPGRWMTGTQNHECIAGTLAAIDYLASLGDSPSRREALDEAFEKITAHENELTTRALRRLRSIDGLEIFGITNETRRHERVSTFSFRHPACPPREMAHHLGDAGIFVWHGNYYALPLTEALGIEPEGAVRAGFLHYNTLEEVDRLVDELETICLHS
tara:strand:+ start:34 stop:1278 length:1245 start_codon:yes stop_codon:yes gene_type:complete